MAALGVCMFDFNACIYLNIVKVIVRTYEKTMWSSSGQATHLAYTLVVIDCSSVAVFHPGPHGNDSHELTMEWSEPVCLSLTCKLGSPFTALLHSSVRSEETLRVLAFPSSHCLASLSVYQQLYWFANHLPYPVGRERRKEEADHSGWVGGNFNKQGDLFMRFVLGIWKMSRSPYCLPES